MKETCVAVVCVCASRDSVSSKQGSDWCHVYLAGHQLSLLTNLMLVIYALIGCLSPDGPQDGSELCRSPPWLVSSLAYVLTPACSMTPRSRAVFHHHPSHHIGRESECVIWCVVLYVCLAGYHVYAWPKLTILTYPGKHDHCEIAAEKCWMSVFMKMIYGRNYGPFFTCLFAVVWDLFALPFHREKHLFLV